MVAQSYVEDDVRFDDPVHVYAGSPTKVRAIASARGAAHYLQYEWPAAPGLKHLQARLACLAVLEGRRKAASARKAFEMAAIEVNILVPGNS